jgi:hypothetical protein
MHIPPSKPEKDLFDRIGSVGMSRVDHGNPGYGNPAVPRVIANRSSDRLKPKVPGGITLGNLRPFLAK